MAVLDLSLQEAYRILQNAGYRMTAPRRAVVQAILEEDRNFTGATILAKVDATTRAVGRATIFRTLDLLVELGMVSRVRHPDGGLGYVVCPREHHHHAICSSCGLVVDLPGCQLDPQAGREALALGFQLHGHNLDYYGLCSSCQREERS